jgi:hypothetical protein
LGIDSNTASTAGSASFGIIEAISYLATALVRFDERDGFAVLCQMAPLKKQEALIALAAAMHLCNRRAGTARTCAVLMDFIEAAPKLQRTVSLPTPSPACPAETALLPAQPIFRGRWADLDSDDEA